ncbi:MAG: extracellular solute-binding protein [Oscillospiraceae bacterium]|nr:extracellular solute-binding protein [Oscillospiraceae bacterium]
MNLKKLLALLLALVLVAGLAACGGGGETATTPAPADPGETGTPAPAPQDDPPAQIITLTYYGFSEWTDSDPFRAVYEEAVAKFEAENPGYRIELQSDPWGDWEMQYRAMFAAGNPADIFIVNNPDFPVFANSGALLNLDDFVEPGYFNQFFPGVLDFYTWQGNTMAIPFTTDCRILWWNRDIFEEAGLDPDVPPATWDELIAFANQITENTGSHGFGMDLGLTEFPAQALFNASTGSVLDVAADGSITPTVDTPEFRAYLQMLLDLQPTFQPDFAVTNHHDVARLFAAGQFGMIIGNTLVETDVYDHDFWGQGFVPRMNATAPHGSFGGGFGIAVSANTAAPEAAVRFAQILTSAEFNSRLISDFPASEAGIAVSDFAADPNFAVYLEVLPHARQAQPKTLFYAEIEAAIHEVVAAVLIGGMDIDTAVEELTNRITAVVNG